MAGPTAVSWAQLSTSSRTAFEWAAASVAQKTGVSPQEARVGTGSLLLGIMNSHRQDSEPLQLLEHFGKTREDLLPVLARISTGAPFDPQVTARASLNDMPPIRRNPQAALEVARKIWDRKRHTRLPLSHLFGGLLGVPQSSAYKALAQLLEGVDLRALQGSYSEFLGSGLEYREFLRERFPVDPPDPENGRGRRRVGNLGGAGNDRPAEVDQLGFDRYVTAFVDLIASEETKPPLTIGIYGSWGMGKSFLLGRITDRLCSEESGDGKPPRVRVVAFNAWEYSATEVIWPGLVRRIMDTLEREVPWYKRYPKRFRRNFVRQIRTVRGRLIFGAAGLAALAIITLWQADFDVGVVAGVLAALGLGGILKLVADTFADPMSKWVTALFEESDYGRHIGYMEEIKDDLADLEERLSREDGRVLVVIDDLDRCEPEKAVEVLQAINRLLNFDSFIVCLGIDARIITKAVERHYEGLLGKAGASGYEYLDKIVQIPFRIPQASAEEIKAFLGIQLGDPQPEENEEEQATDGVPIGQSAEPVDDTESESKSVDREGTPTSTKAVEPPVAFRWDERQAFEDLARFLRRNPRHLKRLVNVYRLVRTLAYLDAERAILDHPRATIRWLTMCGQWPYTSVKMLDRLEEMLEDWDGEIPEDAPAGDPLLHLLTAVTPRLEPRLRDRLDDDAETLQELLEVEDCGLTWDELRRVRKYTINFNPAVEEDAGLDPEEAATARGNARAPARAPIPPTR